MKIREVALENFRSYKDRISVTVGKLTVFVGQNDIGKSTILEALDVFLNEKEAVSKIEKDDVNKHAEKTGDTEIKISVVFEGIPDELTIDSTNFTTLRDEFLLNKDGNLEIIKKYPNGGTAKVFVKALHPTNPKCAELLLLKQTELKKLLTDEMVCKDKTKNAEIRRAIWGHHSNDLNLQEIEIELAKFEAKNSWDQLKRYLPVFALFQSDRKNSDGDAEIQNPMKFAVQEILKDESLVEALNLVANEVEKKLGDVATRTLNKLKDMNPEIAKQLVPIIPKPENLKWMDVFKNVSISTDEDILINKRGSGVKRLVLLNFFRAEAERRRDDSKTADIIYAIEEPETSQHPKHQRMLVEALKELAQSQSTQVLMTTHSPSIVKLLEFENLRLIINEKTKDIVSVNKKELPYPSLNEINFLAFGESDEEYHNELYAHIELSGWFDEFKTGRTTLPYIRDRNGTKVTEQKILSELIRHQIHHPENTYNKKYSDGDLQKSISEMRTFIESKV
ncbi:MAG: AAA family ATPase [Candidatus Competibacter sp.]|nr:AAA family ATPase [Candidatus Competibacter sp.]